MKNTFSKSIEIIIKTVDKIKLWSLQGELCNSSSTVYWAS